MNARTTPKPSEHVSEHPGGYPTVLIAVHADEMRRAVAAKLERHNWLVLEADSIDSALHFVQMHSRPIHVVVLDAAIRDSAQGALFGKYRPNMHIVALSPTEPGLACDLALAQLEQRLPPLPDGHSQFEH